MTLSLYRTQNFQEVVPRNPDGVYDLLVSSARTLLIISGPIASGKSTAAELVAAEFRGRGRSTALVDLDRLYHRRAEAQNLTHAYHRRDQRQS